MDRENLLASDEIQRIFEQLGKANSPESEQITADLQQLFLKNNNINNDEIYLNLQKLVSSTDPNEKYNGLIGIEQISFVVQENQYLNFWSKFYQMIFDEFQTSTEEKLLKKNAEVFGRLLRLGGQRVSNVIVSCISTSFDSLSQPFLKDNKKYACLLALKELLEHSPFVTFKTIVSTDNYRQTLWTLVKSKNILVREAALGFFDQYMRHISIKEPEVQKKEYAAFFGEIKDSMRRKEEEIVIGNIQSLRIIFSYPSQDQFSEQQFTHICEFVLYKKESSSPAIQQAVIDTIPVLAAFKKQFFSEKFFTQTVEHLLNLINSKSKSSSCYYNTLDKICVCLDGGVLKKLNEDTRKIIFNEVKLVVSRILMDLSERREYISSRVSCLLSVLRIFSSQYNELIKDEDSMINQIIFNGLYPQSVEFLKQLPRLNGIEGQNERDQEDQLRKKRKTFSMFMQYRVLLCIMVTLSRRKNVIPSSLLPENDAQRNFLLRLRQALDKDQSKSNEEREISDAIQTLSNFKFSSYDVEITNFVKDNVLDFLDNKNKNIRKAAAKAGCLLSAKRDKYSLISNSVMYKILEKFMSVAVSDSEDEIRQTMLKSLNENFDQYLIEPIYLKKLFFCVNDSNLEVQQLALMTLCRLSKNNPSDIIPFLKKILFEFISQLSQNNRKIENEKKTINLLRGLIVLMKHEPEVVKPHSATISSLLLRFLKDSNMTNNMIPEILRAFSQLSTLGDFQRLLNMDEVFPIFLQAMQDKSSTTKREAAVKSLVEILKNTGFVVLPYYKYPKFLDILLSLMKNEVNAEMRLHSMRLIGCLGAIDYFFYKKVHEKIRRRSSVSPIEDNRSLVNLIVNKSFKKRFKHMKRKEKYSQQSNISFELHSQLHKYYEDVILLENFKQTKMFLHIASLMRNNNPNHNGIQNPNGNIAGAGGAGATAAATIGSAANPLFAQAQFGRKPLMIKQEQRDSETPIAAAVEDPFVLYQHGQEKDEEIVQILQAPTVIQLNDQDFYSRTTLKAILKILFNQFLNEHHLLALQTLNCIISVLKSRTKNFLDLLIPVFCKVVDQESIRVQVLNLILHIIENCGVHYNQEYLDPLIKIILEYASDPRYTLIGLKILKHIADFQKRYIRYKIEPIVHCLNGIIQTARAEEEVTIRIIRIYKRLAELLNQYLHLIIPFMCLLISQDMQLVNINVKTEIVQLFQNLALNCSSNVQFLSLIVESLLQNILINKFYPLMTNCIMDTIVVFIYKYDNDFQAYLPKVKQAVISQSIHHNIYAKSMEIFVNYGNLYDVAQYLENDIAILERSKPQEQPFTLEPVEQLYRSIKADRILRVFDTSSNLSKEDWTQWMRKTSVELIKESPNIILSSCHQLAEVYQELQAELYNLSFSCVWNQLREKEKDQIIAQLEPALNLQHKEAEKVPLVILQTLLNLAEFMQHDKGGLPIKNESLADLAERCLAYAKALHYREKEFERAGEEAAEALEALYNQLGQKEAANGLQSYVSKHFVKPSHAGDPSQQSLMSTDISGVGGIVSSAGFDKKPGAANVAVAQKVTHIKLSDKSHFVNKIKQYHSHSEWQQVLNLFREEDDPELKKQVLSISATAAMNLGKWEHLEYCTEHLSEENSQDKAFWQAAVSLNKNMENSKTYIAEALQKIDSKVSGLLQESYNRAFKDILRLQQLFEMQEIVEMKETEEKILNTMKTKEGVNQTKLQQILDEKRQHLKDIWADRLRGNPKDIDTWQQILSVRQLFLSKKEDLNSWLKFARLALKNNQLQLCRRVLDQIFSEEFADDEDTPPLYNIANFECMYRIDPSSYQRLCDRMEKYLKNEKKIEKKLVAKMYLKMGNWMREESEVLDHAKMKKIEEYYEKSKEFKPEYYKTWHHFALLNFSAISTLEGQSTIDEQTGYIINALRGFMRSVGYGTSSEHKSPTLFQDSLRLLNLIFEHGEQEEVQQLFLEEFKQIDSRAWIEVVPQIIARISDSKAGVQRILHELLIHMSLHHSQALIYPLTVACKSKTQIRQQAANHIIADIKTHSPALVNEAMLISAELNRAAILLKEQWYEGIFTSNAPFQRYYMQKEQPPQDLLKILGGLHETMNLQPESLSEISFHQNFGAMINEAEAWLQRFSISEIPACLFQAFDIYSCIYNKLKAQIERLNFVYLENVSPKLLATKNCEISIPGVYKPSRPVIHISCFQHKLEVLPSKTHPRKLCVYGSDSKEYYFLLKGHEDIRQDERVMQLFALVNRLLQNNQETEKKALGITRYAIIPLSINTGLLGWVQNCDTLLTLIRDYRNAFNVKQYAEFNLMEHFHIYEYKLYNLLPLPHKVEIYRYIKENTLGEEIKRILWLKSPNSEIWLERRTNYTRSLAVMSIIGYILGLGDRHLSNIMLQRETGKIVHIDFGDCFEVTMRRESFPEKVPFRLTRMLVNAMEACGIEGNYRNTCELVIKVIRENKESLIAVLEAFVYDPLFYWMLMTISGDEQTPQSSLKNDLQKIDPKATVVAVPSQQAPQQQQQQQQNIQQQQQQQLLPDDQKKLEDGHKVEPQQIFNKKAVEVMERIKKKLNGRDFKETESLSYVDQVSKLINQATLDQNICQCYIGWCPFW